MTTEGHDFVDHGFRDPDLGKVAEATDEFARPGYLAHDFGAPGRSLYVRRDGEVERRLAASGATGDDYPKGKTALIQELSDAARTERGLPPEPVWEE